MSELKKYKLGDVAQVIGGGTPSTTKEEYWNGEIGWLTPRDLTGYSYKYISKGERNITEEGLKNSSARLIPEGTVLMTSRAPIGYLAIAGKELCTNQGFKSFIVDEDKINNEYLYYLLKSNIDRIKSLGTGSTFAEVSASILKSFEIEIPDLPTQKEIASILSSLDEKIELNLQMNQTLEAMAQAIFKEWFVNFNFPGFDGELVDGLPKGWNRCLIKDFGKIVCGKTPSKAVKEYFGGEYMFIKIPDMHNSVFIIETTDSLTEEGVNSQSNKTIPPFSICVSSIATVGLVCINPEPCQTNQQINSIIPKNKDLRYFLYFLTTSMKDTFLATASGGTATLNMNTSQFSNIRAFMPSEDVLNEFDEIVSPIMEKILENEYNIKSLTQTRDTLLPKLMSGQLEIS
ncbi:MAG: restriction endonuclease subunit S [Kiritimatiellae bacterium]|jgi:type I restriction enzyme S subunit|nr:restriction endonuclease subunit S [Kiritimatiellia bacterium]